MCGIAGFVAGDQEEQTIVSLRQMSNALRHRGPDDEGYLTMGAGGNVTTWAGPDTPDVLQLPLLPTDGVPARLGFAHRRLSILDLSPAGHQPMAIGAERYWIVFNGEIYNYIELRRQLEQAGYTFHTESDTEVLLAGYAKWGSGVLSHLEGMFAFAILDRDEGIVFLARDHFGIKPLYYTRAANGTFAFASEIKALLGLPGVSSAAYAPALFEFLRYGVSDHGGRTVFAEIQQLPAAHTLTIRINGGPMHGPARYWTLPQRTNSFTSFSEATHALRDAFEQSVKIHMRSDVPVGSCLSGGLDSTAIIALAAPMAPSAHPLRTISFISPDPVVSEERFVQMASESLPIVPERVYLTADNLAADIEHLVWTQEVPFGSLSIYAQYGVFRCAKAHGLTVMLDGQGSDELLGGYNTAVSAAIAERLATGRILDAVRLIYAFAPVGTGAHLRTLLSALGRFVPAGIAPFFMHVVGEPVVPPWLDGRWFSDRGPSATVRPQGKGKRALDDELRLFTELLSLPQLLRYEDRNSMAFSIESRVPFCDVRVAEVAACIPTDMLVTDRGETKAVLRAAMRGIVPAEIIDRPKIGFATPDQQWLTSLRPWLMTLVREDGGRLPFLRVKQFALALDGKLEKNSYFPSIFWRVLNTILWARTFGVDIT